MQSVLGRNNKPRGAPRVDDRRVLDGIFWALRSGGAPWADLPERHGPRSTVYNRFNRWRKAGVWDRLMDALVKAHDGDVQMIDTSIVRVHQQGATAKGGSRSMSGSLPRRAHNQNPHARRQERAADQAQADRRSGKRHRRRARDDRRSAQRRDAHRRQRPRRQCLARGGGSTGAWANIPPKANRKTPICFSKHLYKARNLVERFFNKIKQFRRIATRYDKLAETFLAALK